MRKLWRVIYPFLLHYVLVSAGVNFFFWLICVVKGSQEDFYDYAMLVNGLASVFLALPAALWLYQRDLKLRQPFQRQRRLQAADGIWCFLWGASLAIMLNIAFSLLQIFQRFPTYSEQTQRMTENVNLLMVVFWTAAAAPLVEELVCRGLVYRRLRDYTGIWPAVLISGLMFGVYHGNVVQAIYATILGIIMALLVELTGSLWSSILFHVGANLISVLFSEFAVQLAGWHNGLAAALVMALLFCLFWGGCFYFYGRWRQRKRI